jgi:hypothetical protein
MKAWHCRYRWHGGYGAYQDYDCIVIAEIKSKALGMALMEYPDTSPEDWEAEEIPLDKEYVHQVSSAGT